MSKLTPIRRFADVNANTLGWLLLDVNTDNTSDLFGERSFFGKGEVNYELSDKFYDLPCNEQRKLVKKVRSFLRLLALNRFSNPHVLTSTRLRIDTFGHVLFHMDALDVLENYPDISIEASYEVLSYTTSRVDRSFLRHVRKQLESFLIELSTKI